jgi:hypothetical protein
VRMAATQAALAMTAARYQEAETPRQRTAPRQPGQPPAPAGRRRAPAPRPRPRPVPDAWRRRRERRRHRRQRQHARPARLPRRARLRPAHRRRHRQQHRTVQPRSALAALAETRAGPHQYRPGPAAGASPARSPSKHARPRRPAPSCEPPAKAPVQPGCHLDRAPQFPREHETRTAGRGKCKKSRRRRLSRPGLSRTGPVTRGEGRTPRYAGGNLE